MYVEFFAVDAKKLLVLQHLENTYKMEPIKIRTFNNSSEDQLNVLHDDF